MVPTTFDARHLDRLPADDLHKVTAEHVWNAVQRQSTEAVAHTFGESREFDLRGKVALIIHTERLLTILSLADIALGALIITFFMALVTSTQRLIHAPFSYWPLQEL